MIPLPNLTSALFRLTSLLLITLPCFVFSKPSTTSGAPSAASNPSEFDQLRTFIQHDDFKYNAPGYVFPQPMPAPEDLRAFAKREYLNNAKLRCMLAAYFFRFSAALYDHNIVDYDLQPGSVLYEFDRIERKLRHFTIEMPGQGQVIQVIERMDAWFALDNDARRDLDRANEASNRLNHQCEDDLQQLEALKSFVSKDLFTAPTKTHAPQPAKPTRDMIDYMRAHNRSPAIKRAMVHYYLRYASAMYKANHLAANVSSDDLLGQFFDLEKARIPPKTRDLHAIESIIKKSSRHFMLEDDDEFKRLLRANEKAYRGCLNRLHRKR